MHPHSINLKSLLVGISLATSAKARAHKRPILLRLARRILQLLLATSDDDTTATMWSSSKGRNHHYMVNNAGEFAVLEGFRNGNPALYYLGLIDFLQPFNARKLAEYHLKSLVYDRRSFSCIPPEPYADRFLDFMVQHIKWRWRQEYQYTLTRQIDDIIIPYFPMTYS